MNYIYIDESGELGKQTNYFIIGAIIVNNSKDLDRLIKKIRRKYKKELSKASELKGSKIDNKIIKDLLGKLNNKDYKAIIIIFDKKHGYKLNNYYKSDYNTKYNILASQLSKELIINSKTSIFIDKSKNKEEEIKQFNNMFLSNLNNIKNYDVNIKHVNSVNYYGVQVIDLIVWSVFQCVEKENNEFISLIKNIKIKKV